MAALDSKHVSHSTFTLNAEVNLVKSWEAVRLKSVCRHVEVCLESELESNPRH